MQRVYVGLGFELKNGPLFPFLIRFDSNGGLFSCECQNRKSKEKVKSFG